MPKLTVNRSLPEKILLLSELSIGTYALLLALFVPRVWTKVVGMPIALGKLKLTYFAYLGVCIPYPARYHRAD